jgi:Protein of Unknown function (DUF2784)
MGYGFLADVVVTVHLAFVSFVLIGQILILVGMFCRWSWVRNPWFRIAHLLAIGIVVFEAVNGIECPLTTWERDLRALAGQEPEDISFVGRLVRDLLFFECSEETFTAIYICFGSVVLLTFAVVPPRKPCGRRHKKPDLRDLVTLDHGEFTMKVEHSPPQNGQAVLGNQDAAAATRSHSAFSR